jgi:hypothetical protein
VVGAGLLWLLIPSQPTTAEDVATDNWCGTQQVFENRLKARGVSALSVTGACPQEGPCDNPAIRNTFFSGARIKIVRLYVQALCADDGSNAAATAQDVAIQIDSLNRDFAPLGIRFEYGLRFVNSTRFRFLISFAEAENMKAACAVSPNTQLNVYVTTNGFCTCSYATYPWDPAALTANGGIVMTRERFYPQSVSATTLTHEVGHCLGLWHTHRGVNEVPPCGDCYEWVDAGNRDVTGDFCEDTDPTPSNVICAPPVGDDLCSGRPWGMTDFQNYMGYAPDPCLAEFSPQQIARMQCWTESNINAVMKASMGCDTLFVAAPATVNLAADFGGTVSAWHWDFGDGQTSTSQNPAHTFAVGGLFDIACTVTTDSGNYTIRGLPPMYVTSETLIVADKVADTNSSARVDISVDNRVPLTLAVIPFTWAGDFGLRFDSVSTAGLRTANLTTSNGGITAVNKQLSSGRMTLELRPDSAQPIQPGSGSILSLYFHTPSVLIAGANPIQIVGYDGHLPRLRTIPGDYTPHIVNGSISLTCCAGATGNIDGDPADQVDIADISMLIGHLFIDFRPLNCAAEANIDGDPDGTVDIADLSGLIDYLYINFTPPAMCR